MAIAISLLIAGAGAILIWGVDVSLSGVELDVVGWILLLLGGFGVLTSMLLGIPERRRDVDLVDR
jgi:hypothetical protein